jgi:16S rRNA (cytidine1402-2'-O)-methyltransferase
VLPLNRQVVVAREMTKLHETIVKDSLENLLALIRDDSNMRRGEFVVIVDGATIDKKPSAISDEEKRLLEILLKECSLKTAVALAVEISGGQKKALYQAALELSKNNSDVE